MEDRPLRGKEAIALIAVALILVFASLFVGWRFGLQVFDPFHETGGLSEADFDATYHIVQSEFYEATDTSPLVGDAIAGFLGGLNDPYSFYLPKDIYSRMVAQSNAELFDPGILFIKKNGVPVVLDVYAGSPAESAGLLPGDEITSINGTSVASLQGTLQMTSALLGKPGDVLNLGITTVGGSKKNIAITIANYEPPIAAFKMLNGGIGYLQIYSFDKQLVTDFVPTEKQLRENNVSRLVIDLRNTPGGDVDTEISILDKFLNSGIIATEYIGNSGKPTIDRAAGDAEFPNMTIAILVNGLTASAGEMFTAALQENGRATVIGTTTEGKAIEQSYFPLSDGSAIYLTVAKWLTPDGVWIQGKGLAPDIAVPEIPGTDAPLQKAIEILSQN